MSKKTQFFKMAKDANGRDVVLNDEEFNELVLIVYPEKTEEQVSKYQVVRAFNCTFVRRENDR